MSLSSIWNTIYPILIAILFFELIIIIHEGGHFVAARLMKIKVNEFSIGMGPKIFSFTKGATKYSLRWILFGGYCAMEGEDEDSEESGSFSKKSVGARLFVVAAGAVMNLILGFLIIVCIVSSGDLIGTPTVAKFDETIEAHIRTGCDGRHAEQQIRGAVVLPHGTGKTVRVLVFAKNAKADEAQAAGADYVGAEELIPKIQNEGWLDFDVVVATPDMMGVVGRLGRVLGPKGLMPNPKAGTVTMDVAKAVQDIKAGKIEYRLDKTNIIHVPIGKASFTEEQLADNFQTLMGAIIKARPSALKGVFLKSVSLASTMGPSVKVNPVKLAQ